MYLIIHNNNNNYVRVLYYCIRWCKTGPTRKMSDGTVSSSFDIVELAKRLEHFFSPGSAFDWAAVTMCVCNTTHSQSQSQLISNGVRYYFSGWRVRHITLIPFSVLPVSCVCVCVVYPASCISTNSLHLAPFPPPHSIPIPLAHSNTQWHPSKKTSRSFCNVYYYLLNITAI